MTLFFPVDFSQSFVFPGKEKYIIQIYDNKVSKLGSINLLMLHGL